MAKLHESAMRKSPRFEGNPAAFGDRSVGDDQGGGTLFRLNGNRAGSPRDLHTGSIALNASRLIKIKAWEGSMCCMCRSWGGRQSLTTGAVASKPGRRALSS